MFDTPILFVIFNRIDTTKKVFEAIRTVKPKKLFVSADGPRINKDGEADKCEEVRSFVLNSIDWECEVKTLFREKNLGSGPAVSNAITWFFSQVEYGIILEDDCLPDNSFFEYAAVVLQKYEQDERIMHVSGCNLQAGIRRGNASYFFSKLPATWGWATWRRAWQKFSFDFFDDNDIIIASVLRNNLDNESDVIYYLHEFSTAKDKLVSAWDYQWLYTLFKHDAICITPQFNLIENIGFNSLGTHTLSAPHWYKYLVSKSVTPLILANEVLINKKADSFYLNLTMGRRSCEIIYAKLFFKLRSHFNLK